MLCCVIYFLASSLLKHVEKQFVLLITGCMVKEFYHKSGNKPKIFGTTASPVIRKGKISSIVYGLILPKI